MKAWKAESRWLPQAGLYRVAGPDGSALILNGQTHTSAEAHADYTSFELSIQGQRVIVDSGTYAPGSEEQEEKYFSTAIAHNLFLVEETGARVLPAASVEYLPRPPRDWESGRGYIGLCLPGPTLPFPEPHHWRAWYCLERRFWVILDRLEGEGQHSGTSLLHFYPSFEVEVAPDRAIARSPSLAATVIPFGLPRAQMNVSRGDSGRYASWYAPAFGTKYPSSVLSLRWANLRVPWVGGQVIVEGADQVSVAAADLEGETGTLALEISGKRYHLPLPSRGPRSLMWD